MTSRPSYAKSLSFVGYFLGDIAISQPISTIGISYSPTNNLVPTFAIDSPVGRWTVSRQE